MTEREAFEAEFGDEMRGLMILGLCENFFASKAVTPEAMEAAIGAAMVRMAKRGSSLLKRMAVRAYPDAKPELKINQPVRKPG